MPHPATIHRLSKTERRAYDFIVGVWNETGDFATGKQMAAALHVSRNYALKLVSDLRKRGFVTGINSAREPVFFDDEGTPTRLEVTFANETDDEAKATDDASVLAELRHAEREISDALQGGLPLYRMTLRLRTSVLPSLRRAIELAAPARRTLDG